MVECKHFQQRLGGTKYMLYLKHKMVKVCVVTSVTTKSANNLSPDYCSIFCDSHHE